MSSWDRRGWRESSWQEPATSLFEPHQQRASEGSWREQALDRDARDDFGHEQEQNTWRVRDDAWQALDDAWREPALPKTWKGDVPSDLAVASPDRDPKCDAWHELLIPSVDTDWKGNACWDMASDRDRENDPWRGPVANRDWRDNGWRDAGDRDWKDDDAWRAPETASPETDCKGSDRQPAASPNSKQVTWHEDPWHKRGAGDPWAPALAGDNSKSSVSVGGINSTLGPGNTGDLRGSALAVGSNTAIHTKEDDSYPNVAESIQAGVVEDPTWPQWEVACAANTVHEVPGVADEVWWDEKKQKVQSHSEQHERRQKEFYQCQDWYKAQGILPGSISDNMREAEVFEVDLGHDAVRDFTLYDHVSCDISGRNTDAFIKVQDFDQMYELFRNRVPAKLIDNIRSCGYEKPTPVQTYSIPVALAGRDVMCCAQTGSGKTAAFLVPILSSMIKAFDNQNSSTGALDKPFEGPCKPDTIVLSPTRELCLQIFRETLKFCHQTPYRAVRVYGQEPVANQIREVAKGADIIVATPGRLWDFVSSRIVVLTEVNTLVIDEADIMISRAMDGFIREIVEKFDMPSKNDRQTMMFSATFPAEIQKLATEYLYDHVWIGIGPVGGTSCTVSQHFVQVDPQMKLETLLDQLYDFLQRRDEGQRVIVFTNSRSAAKNLDNFLWDSRIDSGALHGDLTQAEREQSLNKFRKGEIDVLVCTDLASRGLDISGVAHVINYDMPRDIDVYVQRIGRTGRIGRRGCSTTYIGVKDGNLLEEPAVIKGLTAKTKEASCKVPDWLERHATHGGNSSNRDTSHKLSATASWDGTWQR